MAKTLKRAVSQEQKDSRRREILLKAGELFLDRDYESVKLTDVSQSLGLVKGTLYLYFATKEELFLALMEMELMEWFEEVRLLLSSQEGGTDRESLAWSIASSLDRRQVLVRLFSILHVILEKHVEPEKLLDFKRRIHAFVIMASGILEEAFPWFRGRAGEFLMTTYVLAIGAGHLSHPTELSRALLERHPELDFFRLDFKNFLGSALSSLLRGWRS